MVVALSFSPSSASAAGASTSPSPPASSADQAREHYERGLAKYNLADFDAAIVEFKQSYEISKAPRLLFNIAQAYRLKKDYESALFFYNTYLRAETSAPNREDVESKIDEMKKAMDARGRSDGGGGTPPSSDRTVHPPAIVAPSPASMRRERQRYIVAGSVTAGLGLLIAGAGGGLLGLAANDASTLHKVAVNGDMWSAHYDDVYREGDRSQTAGIALLAVGGAAIVAGGVVAIMGLRIKAPPR